MLAKEFGKMATKKIEENIMSAYGKEIIKDSAKLLERQAIKHLG
jgi:hypothetical protein